LKLQIHQQSQVPQPDLDGTGNESEDEIDAALTDLQVSLEGSAVSATGDITRTPELHGYIRFFKYAFCHLLCTFDVCAYRVNLQHHFLIDLKNMFMCS